ncbi:MAG TPA: Spy/CpxP family protein refolding chaperone [Acidisphaera sp.]|nr:Spy/CpxP family protein refolding chaperone [Acidisphaera sp.]
MQAAPGVASATEPSDKPAFGLPTSAARVEARIAYLHKTLGITSAQEPQFSAYAEVMRANAQAMRTLFQQRAHTNDATADGRLRWYAQLSAAYADAMQKQLAVFEPLYQSLSDAQKKAADAAFADLRIRPRHRHAG